jgi:hypothetical protein
MIELSIKAFDALARATFAAALEPHGFTAAGSRRCTLHRKISSNVYHFVVADRSLRLPQYTVHIFPHSPLLDADFHSKFPDNLGFTTDVDGYLSEKGVGMRQRWYWCKNDESFERNFQTIVRPAVLEYAIPFLDSLPDLASFARVVRRGYFAERLKELGRNIRD